jgi:hypothetical protein
MPLTRKRIGIPYCQVQQVKMKARIFILESRLGAQKTPQRTKSSPMHAEIAAKHRLSNSQLSHLVFTRKLPHKRNPIAEQLVKHRLLHISWVRYVPSLLDLFLMYSWTSLGLRASPTMVPVRPPDACFFIRTAKNGSVAPRFLVFARIWAFIHPASPDYPRLPGRARGLQTKEMRGKRRGKFPRV